MDPSRVVPQFVKFLTNDDCASDLMTFPQKFCDEYQSQFVENVKLKIRNGYRIWVRFDKMKCMILGMKSFFIDFGLVGGEILVFEHRDNMCFGVYIIGRHGAEIQYPSVVHASQNCSPRTVKVIPGGWKFVKRVICTEELIDEVVPPRTFRAQFAPHIATRVKYVLSNGEEFSGRYARRERTLSGLAPICHALGLSNFNSFDLLVFTYDFRRFTVSMYDGRNVDIVLDERVIGVGRLSDYLSCPLQFLVEVQPFHMLTHCHGVDVRGEFEGLRCLWKPRDQIVVYKDNQSWVLEVRKRPDSRRTTIHDGWLKFRDDLELTVGDKCIFKWQDDCCQKFIVDVFRASEVGNVA